MWRFGRGARAFAERAGVEVPRGEVGVWRLGWGALEPCARRGACRGWGVGRRWGRVRGGGRVEVGGGVSVPTPCPVCGGVEEGWRLGEGFGPPLPSPSPSPLGREEEGGSHPWGRLRERGGEEA